MLDTQSVVEVAYDSSGADKAAADFDRVERAQLKLNETSRLGAVVSDTLAKAALGVQKSLRTYELSLDPLSKALAKVADGERYAATARLQGIEITDGFLRAQANARARVDELTASLKSNAAAQALASAAAARQIELDKQRQVEQRSGTRAQQIVGRSTVVPDRGADLAAYGAEMDRLRAKLSPLFALQQEYKASLTEISQAARVGAISEAERAAAVTRTKAAFADQVRSLNEHTAAAGLNRNQLMELTHVGRSMSDMMMAGASAEQALQVEAGRLVQVFTEGKGGVTGTLKAAGGYLVSMLTPMRLLIGGTALLGVTSAVAYAQWESAQKRLNDALDGTGRHAGATVAQLNAIAKAGAAAGNISYGQGQDLAATFTRSGITPDVTRQAIGYTRAYGHLTDQDLPDAGKAIAEALAEPSQGALTLNKSLGFLDDRLKTTIDNLVAQGRIDYARRALSEGVNKALAETSDKVGLFGRALEEAKNFFPWLGRSVGAIVDGQTDQERLKSLKQERANLPAPLGGVLGSVFGPGNSAAQGTRLDGQIAALEAKIAGDAKNNDAAAAQTKREADAQALSLKAGDVVRSVLPELVQAQTTANNIAALEAALSSPLVLSKMGMSHDQVGQALSNTRIVQANADPIQRMVQDNNLAIQSIEAFSLAERVAVEARKAELAALREHGSLVQAATAAEAAHNVEIAKANNAASDRLDQARQDHALVGLSPAERGLREIENKYTGVGGYFDKDSASKKELTTAMRPVADDLKSAGEMLADAIKQSAARVASSGAALGSFNTGAASPTPFFAQGFNGAVNRTLGFEGGLNRADTNGKPSNFGINQAAYPGLNVATISQDQAKGIYKRDYWDAIGADSMSPQMARVAFDTAVMEGVGKTMKLIGQSGGDANRLLDLRQGFESTLIARNPSKYGPYAKAWAGRDAGLRADINSGTSTAASPQLTTATSTARADDQKSLGLQRGDYLDGLVNDPLKTANTGLTAQIASLNLEKTTLGETAAQIRAAADAQKLLDDYQAQGVTQQLVGADRWKRLNDGVNSYRDNLAKVYQGEADFQAQQQRMVGTLDDIRSASKGALSTFNSDLRQGKSLGTALTDVASGLEDKLISMAENQLIDSLFGKSGTSNGGIFGGGLMSLISGLTGAFTGGGGGALAGLGSAGGGIGMNAAGTDDWRGGLTWVGEKGPELVNLQPHTQVLTNAVSMRAAAAAAASGASSSGGTGAGAGGGSGGAPNIEIHNYGQSQVTTQQGRGRNGKDTIRIMVDDAMAYGAATNSRGYQAIARRSGIGRTGRLG